jgi:hypothetical protein
MNLLRRHVLFIALIGLIAMTGCAGGGGSSAPVTKDVAGINATISGFMASIANRDSVAASKFLAAETSSSESSVHTLMVYDFGSDINDPNDERAHYSFTVTESDIVQLSDSVATVKAYYKLQSGEPLWLTFALIKESGVWIIETITVGATNTDAASSFVASTYFPVVPGAVAKFNHYYQGESTGGIYTRSFASSSEEQGGMMFYQLLESYDSSGSGTSIRAETSVLHAPAVFYSHQSCGLWVYSPTLNDGEPFNFFQTSHAFGSSHTIQFTSRDSQSNLITHSVAVSFGYPETVPTDMGNMQAVPVTFVTTVKYPGSTSVSKSKIWYAANIGKAVFESFMNPNDSTAMYSEKISQYTTPSVPTTPTTPPTGGVTSGNVAMTESPSAPANYLYASMDVNASTGDFNLRTDSEGQLLLFQAPPDGTTMPENEAQIELMGSDWSWYPSLPSAPGGISPSLSGKGVFVSLNTPVPCTLRNSSGAEVSFNVIIQAPDPSVLPVDRRTGDLVVYISNYSFSNN